MSATLTTVNQITKEVYEPRIRSQLQSEVTALKRIEASSDGIESQVGAKYVTFAMKTRRNSGIGARNENELLPAAGQQGYATARVSLRYQYGRVGISGQTFELVDTNYQAFANAMESELSGIKDDLRKDLNRQVWGTGSGAVATAGTLNAASNVFKAASTLYVQMGMQIDIIDGTTLGNPTPTIKASNRQVTGIDNVTGFITFDGATVATAVGDVIVRTGNVNREWSGFGAIVSATGVFQNVDPSVEPVWAAVVDSNGGTNRALSEGLMTQQVDKVRQNGGKVTQIFCSLGVRRAYANLLVQQRGFVNTTKFEGGFSGIGFVTDTGEIPVTGDVDCPPNRMYGINEDEITLYREKDWSFMNRDGSNWQRVINYDAYEGTLYQYSQLGTHRRNTHFLLADLLEG